MESLHEHCLEEGDIGTVVYIHCSGLGYEVEFVTLDGSTSRVVELTCDQVRAVSARDIPHARTLTEA